MAHESEDTIDLDDVDTVVDSGASRPESACAADDNERWLSELPPRARAVLRAAARPKPAWPRVPRIIGAVAKPIE